jgi:peroxiredoxin 2/4
MATALSDCKDGRLMRFSHPADCTPVCTHEVVAVAKAASRFEGFNCE